MRKTGKILIAAFFLMTIFLFGSTTALKARGDIIDAVRDNSLSEIPAAIDTAMTENFKSRNNWININGLFQRLAGVTIVRDAGDIDVYKMSNGQLTYAYPDNDMEYAAEEIIGLDRFVRDRGMEFMYVQLPCKAYTDELMPPGTHTYGYADADELITSLNAGNVAVLDLREEIDAAGFSIPELFFNTDHHWKPSTALWAAGVTAARLAGTVEGYMFDPEIYDPANYEKTEYQVWFLGSLGRRTGRFFGGIEDFETLIPRFDTDFHLYTQSQTDGNEREKDGPFADSLMALGYLDEKDLFSDMTYFTYMGNEYRLSTVTNRMAPNDRKILMLRDSFSCTLLPYLALSAGEITAIDMRYYSDLKLKEYIEDNDFDAVIIAYNPSMFREDGAFDFDR